MAKQNNHAEWFATAANYHNATDQEICIRQLDKAPHTASTGPYYLCHFEYPLRRAAAVQKSPIAPLGEAQGQFRSNREGPPSPAFSSATNRITTSSAPQVAGTQPSDRGIGVGTREPAIAAGRLLPMQRGEDVGRAQGNAPAASVTNAERWGLPPFAGVPATMTLCSREGIDVKFTGR